MKGSFFFAKGESGLREEEVKPGVLSLVKAKGSYVRDNFPVSFLHSDALQDLGAVGRTFQAL